MRLTTKGRYAVTAMLDVALHTHAGPVSLAEISTRQGISQAYLEQLFAKLRSKSLVRSLRGPGGGYTLARPEAEISISQIIIRPCFVGRFANRVLHQGNSVNPHKRPCVSQNRQTY